jgi:YHS domain-containing protein/thiol-disulfide isomerase/thioredoxin
MRRILVLMAIAVTATGAGSLPAAEGWQTDFEAARQESQRTGKPLLVHFAASWCLPCRQMESTVFNQPAVIERLESSIVAVKIDVDEHEDLATRFGIESLPCDIFLEPNGERMVESSGFRGVPEYLEMIHRAEARNAELAKARQRKATSETVAQNPAVIGETTPAQSASLTNTAMIDGYCPVTLWESRKWIKGSSELRLEYRNQVYHFSTAEAKEAFRVDPLRYTPRFLGCDPVLVWEDDRAVPGLTQFGAFYDDELYLFTTAANRDRFKSDPDRYIRTRIVLQPDQIETVIR